MSDRFIIQWKSLENGRCGKGGKTFSRQEAEQLVEELNRQFPQIQHELVRAGHAEAVASGADHRAPGSAHRPGEMRLGRGRQEADAVLLKK
jgi:hypothetical protein